MRAPFQQGRFDELPERPRVAHGYFDTEARELQLDSRALGRTRVHLRVHGRGPPLLLVHGLMTSSYSFRYALPLLGASHTLYIPDLPGAGRTEAPLAPRYSPEALADFLGELQAALGIRGCAAIGNSMGGYLCMHLALRDPGAFKALVNVHSPGIEEARLWALSAALAVPGARRLLHWLVRRAPLRWVHRNVHYWDESLKSLEEAREYGGALSRPGGAEGFGKHLAETMALPPMRALRRELVARRARGQPFPVPLLLLYAERDPMVPPRFGDDFARLIPSATLRRLPEASHFMHVDAPERFAAEALRFLRGQNPETAMRCYQLLNGSQIGAARLPDDGEVRRCLIALGAPESSTAFRQVNEFNAPGVFEQAHFAAGLASVGAVKVEEDERGAGRGLSLYLFRRSDGLELYLSRYSGAGGEVAVLSAGDRRHEIAGALLEAGQLAWPAAPISSAEGDAGERLALHLRRCESLREGAARWLTG